MCEQSQYKKQFQKLSGKPGNIDLNLKPVNFFKYVQRIN